jgi:gliding motility associated protien GldN
MKNLPCLFLLLLIQPSLYNQAHAQKAKHIVKSGIPIPWEPINDTDILWKKRIWREIEIYERTNAPLRINQTYSFANILLGGIHSGAIKAYSNEDTGFTTPLTLGAIDTLIQCDAASLSVIARTYLNNLSKQPSDLPIKDTSYILSCSYPQQVQFYQLKEDWIFDRNKGIMVVHIDAIAPAAYQNDETKPLFWLHYPDIAQYINNYKADNMQNNKANYTWYEYFESRQFSSRITNIPGATIEEIPNRHKRKNRKKGYDSTIQEFWVY